MQISCKPKCEQCGIEKQETNHWFMASIRSILVIKSLPEPLTPEDIRDYVALCGAACVSKYVSEHLPNLKKD